MPRYIDADTIVERLDEIQPFAGNKAANAAINLCKDIVRNVPTVSPDEVRGVGEWICDPISAVSPVEEWYCNICKQPAPMGYGKAYVRTNYCPNCGAKMEVTSDA